MAELLKIQSIVDDNRQTVSFCENELPRHSRHGELHVVNGILYTFIDIENDNKGKWIPLSNKMNIYKFTNTQGLTKEWIINPTDFSNDIIVVVYNNNNDVYNGNYTVDINNMDFTIKIEFEEEFDGYAYYYIHNSIKETLINFYYIVDETLGNSFFEYNNDTVDKKFSEFLMFDEYYGSKLNNEDVEFDEDFEKLNEKLGAIVAQRIKK